MIHIPPSFSREKPLHWVASAKKDYPAFPTEVQDEMGYALGLAQLDAQHPKCQALEGLGIFEIVEDFGEIHFARFIPCALPKWCMSFMTSRKNR